MGRASLTRLVFRKSSRILLETCACHSFVIHCYLLRQQDRRAPRPIGSHRGRSRRDRGAATPLSPCSSISTGRTSRSCSSRRAGPRRRPSSSRNSLASTAVLPCSRPSPGGSKRSCAGSARPRQAHATRWPLWRITNFLRHAREFLNPTPVLNPVRAGRSPPSRATPAAS